MATLPNESGNAPLLRPRARKEKRPKLNNADTIDDLINFQLPPRRNQMTPRRSKKPGSTYGWHKESECDDRAWVAKVDNQDSYMIRICHRDAHFNTGFINSAYRFIMRPSATADYPAYFADPDMYAQTTWSYYLVPKRVINCRQLFPVAGYHPDFSAPHLSTSFTALIFCDIGRKLHMSHMSQPPNSPPNDGVRSCRSNVRLI